MVPMLRCSSTKRWVPKAFSVHRIGVVQRLNTMSRTGAIGHLCGVPAAAACAASGLVVTGVPVMSAAPLAAVGPCVAVLFIPIITFREVTFL